MLTRRWRKPDSNSQSHPRERVSFGDKPTPDTEGHVVADERSAAAMIQEIESALLPAGGKWIRTLGPP